MALEAHMEAELQRKAIEFQKKVNDALERAKVILDADKQPVLAERAQHCYSDKYLLAESMTNAAVASQLNCLALLGLNAEMLEQLQGWVMDKKQAVSLEFSAEERCSFLHESTRDVPNPTRHVVEVIGDALQAAFNSKKVTKITEYFWKFQADYTLTVICGVGERLEDRLDIRSRSCEHKMMTTARRTPRPEVRIPASKLSVNITWLLQQLRSPSSCSPSFQIDRLAKECHTPRRNADVEAALEHFHGFSKFAEDVNSYIRQLWNVHPDHGLDEGALALSGILVPVLPLLEDRASSHELADDPDAAVAGTSITAAPATTTTSLSCLQQPDASVESTLQIRIADSNKFLEDEHRCLQKKHEELRQVFPGGSKVVSADEAIMTTTFRHCCAVCGQLEVAIDYIEAMLRRQLIAAIGKAVQPDDFAEYMRFHCRKLFAEAFQPAPFAFAVRRTQHHGPEGTLSIEQMPVGGGSKAFEPVVTMCAHTCKAPKMQFALNASTNVQFGGERHLHGWLQHQFSDEAGSQARLVARARQFSSMIVLIGRLTSATSFAPKHAAIVQNKDELMIPLDMSMIPSAKEFKDAISSLSPDQQNFAKAFRTMQLESTMFGVLIIQIKPQLERVLNLPEDSLTKEIKLTQDLIQLFIKYNIPADLLSYDAASSESGLQERIAAVKQHVEALHDIIKKCKEEEIEQRRKEQRRKEMEEEEERRKMERMREALLRQRAELERLVTDVEQRVQHLRNASCNLESASAGCARPARHGRSFFRSAVETLSHTVSSVTSDMVGHMCAKQELYECGPQTICAYSESSTSVQQTQVPAETSTQGQKAGSGGTEFSDSSTGDAAADSQSAVQGQGNIAPPSASGRDWTEVPQKMDEKFETLDKDAALRPTIINTGEVWSLKAQKAVLASATTSSLLSEDQKSKKEEAFDLLDGLTKAGAIDVEDASLHIVVSSTHCFDKSVMETLVQDNVNPVERVERSTLVMASIVHEQPVGELICSTEKARLASASPQLFLQDH